MANGNRLQAKEVVREEEPALGLKEVESKSKAEAIEPQQTIESASASEARELGDQAEVAPVSEQAAAAAPAPMVVAQKTVVARDRLGEEIDDILEDNLADLYKSMSPADQQKFKEKGEETVSKIRELVRATKINAKRIFKLIREWLKLIPGVNRFFLEQEAKIKTDKILVVSEEERRREQNESL